MTPNWRIRAADSVSDQVVVIDGCAIATVNADDAEFANGYIVMTGDRISSLGDGPAPHIPNAQHFDASGCLATPGLVNTHTHLNQWLTRGMAQQADLAEWLTALYPLWAVLDADLEYAAASAGLAALALSGATTSVDHLYVVPQTGGDVFAAVVEAAGRIGLRLELARGSIDLGPAAGGVAPASIVEDRDAVLAASADLAARVHDPSAASMVRVALAPTAALAVSRELMQQSAELARRLGLRLHTHIAETADEDAAFRASGGRGPIDHLDELGWLGANVWLAHCVHLTDAEIAKLAATGTGVAHCPSSNARLGAGIARLRDLAAAGVAVGLGVDGAAANEAAGLVGEIRQAMLMARARSGAAALSARQALRMATIGGARCLGRAEELGSLEVGKLADIAVWRLDGLGHAGIADPVAALAFSAPAPLRLLLVGGAVVVEDDELRTADTGLVTEAARVAANVVAHSETGSIRTRW
jgi:cytosine/adenosine deaminase-related metal-dependent hydrolase